MSQEKRTWGVYLLLVYVLLLGASYAVRFLQRHDASPPEGYERVTLRSVDQGLLGEKNIEMVYRDLGPINRRAKAPVVVLLHGTPMASATFNQLAPKLAGTYRVLVPDLPGFGGSTKKIPDYSVAAHGGYIEQWLSELKLPSVHIVAYSQGGGAALEIFQVAPERVASLTMLSSIGVQELELMGDYYLNHALYALQLGLLKGADLAVPHFGLMERGLLNVPYARNFMDTDQRPLRDHLRRFDPPMLIVQGEQDRLVPMAAAVEHHRLVPQSRLKRMPGGHMLVYREAGRLAAELDAFIERVDSGLEKRREQADPERVVRANEPFDWSMRPPLDGVSLAIVILLIALSTYISEDLTCITAGLMVARGLLHFIPACFGCLLGIYTGDLLLFLAGKYFGRAVVRRAPFKWIIKEQALQRSSDWFAVRGPAVILLSRFIPGARLGTYLTAGILNTPFLKFSAYFLVAAVIWTPLLVGVSFLFGGQVMHYLETYQRYSLPAVVVLALCLLFMLKGVAPLFSYRGRRLMLSRWRRWMRWEFWPPWVFYPPVLLYVLMLGVKYRCLTLFTAANPAMPEGGFIGESKKDILEALAKAGAPVARYTVLERSQTAEAALESARRFLRKEQLTYPVVLKPDQGERGRGVVIAHSEKEVAQLVKDAEDDLILQEHIGGKEYGVFYYRMPGEDQGHLLGITDKVLPYVVGDGVRTLERLILDDDRAVCSARLYLDRFADRLHEVPQVGEKLSLASLGTHCLGALFLDGGSLGTPELLKAMDEISRPYEGFYFGRYDVRVPSAEALKAGRDITILELNGVTSEATNILPRKQFAYRLNILMKQWCIAFEIGAENRQRGSKPTGLWALIRLVFSRT